MTPQAVAAQLRACPPPRLVHQVLNPGLPGQGQYLSITRDSRLIVMLHGHRHCLVRGIIGPQRLRLDPAAALVLAPGAALVTTPDAPFVSLGATAKDDHGTLTMGRHPTSRNPNHGGAASLFVRAWSLDQPATRELADLLRACLHRSRQPDDLFLRQAVAAATALLAEILDTDRHPHGSHAERLTDLLAFIRAHPDRGLARSVVAARVGCHPNHLARVFQRELGASFRDFVIRARLDRARELLRDPDLPLERIATLCGWSRASTLIAHYHRVFGATPRSGIPVRSEALVNRYDSCAVGDPPGG